MNPDETLDCSHCQKSHFADDLVSGRNELGEMIVLCEECADTYQDYRYGQWYDRWADEDAAEVGGQG